MVPFSFIILLLLFVDAHYLVISKSFPRPISYHWPEPLPSRPALSLRREGKGSGQ